MRGLAIALFATSLFAAGLAGTYKVDGPKVRIVYQFDLQGTVLESTATGELKGSVLEGQYQTKSVADGSGVDEGNWKTTAQ